MTHEPTSSGDRRREILASMLAEAGSMRRARRIRRAGAAAAMLAVAGVIGLWLWRTPATVPEKLASGPTGNGTMPRSVTPAEVPIRTAVAAPAPLPSKATLVRLLVDPALSSNVEVLNAGTSPHVQRLVEPAAPTLVRVIDDDELLEILRQTGQCASIVRVAKVTTLVLRECSGHMPTQ